MVIRSDIGHFLAIMIWSVWIDVLPSREIHVALWMALSLKAQWSANRSPLSFMQRHMTLSLPVLSALISALSSSKIILMSRLGVWSKNYHRILVLFVCGVVGWSITVYEGEFSALRWSSVTRKPTQGFWCWITQHKCHSFCVCMVFILMSRVRHLLSCGKCYAASFIPSAFTDSKYRDAITAHFTCHLCGPVRLVLSTDVPGPNPCCCFYRQKIFRPSGFRQDFTRWRHAALRRGLFANRAGYARRYLRFCNYLYPLVGDWSNQLHQGPR